MAGGFFSGGSSDAVSASVAEAEAAAREAEAARDALLEALEVYGDTDTNNENANYTVPRSGTDAPAATSFLNQEGNWAVPAGVNVDESLSDLTDVDSSLSPDDLQILQYSADNSQWEAVDAAGAAALSGSDTIDITSNVISVEDGSITGTQLADNAVNRDILNITNTGTDGQILSRADDAFTWVDVADDEAITVSLPLVRTGDNITLNDLGIEAIKLAADSVTTAKIVDSNVTTAKIADDAVTSVKILDGTIVAGNMADDAITNAKLADDSVGTSELIDANVTTAKIADVNVTTGKLADSSITTAKINNGSVTVDKLANNSVTTTRIADDAVTSAKIVDGAIGRTELNVTNTGTDGQILSREGDTFTWVDDNSGGGGGTDNITAAGGLVRSGNVISIEDDGVTTVKINDDAVTAAKIADNSIVTANVTDANITTDKLADNSVNATKLNVADNGTSGQLLSSDGDGSFSWVAADGNTAYTASEGLVLDGDDFQIAELGVTSGKLAATSVTTAKIADNAVTGAKIADGTVDTAQLMDGAISTAKLEDAMVTAAKLATDSVSTVKIVDGNVTNAKLANEAVDTAELADNAVDRTKLDTTNTGSDAQVLSRNGDQFTWVANAGGTLQSLSDTNIPASITDRRFLEYNTDTNVWDARAATEFLNLAELFDVFIDTDLADNQFLRYNSTDDRWENESITIPANTGATAPLTKVGNNITLPDLSVSGSKIVNGTLATAKIADGAITAEKMATNSVNTAQLVNTAVSTAKIADGAVTASKIPNNELTAVQLATDSVTSFKIQDGAVIAGKIADNVIGADELNVSGNGSNGQFLTSDGDGTFSWTTSSGGVTYTAGDGLDLSVGNEFSISALGVDTAELADGAVTMSKIADGAVGSGKIADGAVSTTDIADNAVTNDKIPDNGIHGDKITDATISASEIGPSAVTTAKIMDAAVTNAKIGTDVVISSLSDVNTSGVNNGQILTYNGTTWVPTNNSGGGNTDNSRLGITLNPSSLNEGSDSTPITVTLAIVNQISGETISGQSVTVTDPTGHSVAVSGSGNSFTFMASTANNGNFVVRASATFTTGETSTVHSASANLPVHATNADWYQWVTDTQPTAITSTGVVDNGVFSSPETGTWTRPTEDTDSSEMAYVALPTGTYTFRLGLLFADIDDLGVISTNYTLYRINDFAEIVPGGDRIVTITEA